MRDSWFTLNDSGLRLAEVTLVVGVAWVTALALGRRRAAVVRNAIWRAGLCACVLAAVLGLTLNKAGISRKVVHVPLAPALARVAHAVVPPQPRPTLQPPPFVAASPALSGTPPSAAPARAAEPREIMEALAGPTSPVEVPVERLRGGTLEEDLASEWRDVEPVVRPYVLTVLAVLASGWCLFALALLRDVARVALAVRRSRACGDEEVLSAVRDAGLRVPLRRRLRVLSSSDTTVPFVLGGPRPILMLPEGFPVAGLASRAVLTHELAHIRRLDPEFNAAGRLFRIIHWYNPFAWLLERAVRLTAEELADDWALTGFPDPRGYAEQLYACAKAARGPGATAASYRGGVLARRISCIMREGVTRALRLHPDALGVVVFCALAVGVACAAVDLRTDVCWVGTYPNASLPREPVKRAILLLFKGGAPSATDAAVRILRRLGDDGLPAYPQLRLAASFSPPAGTSDDMPEPYRTLFRPLPARTASAAGRLLNDMQTTIRRETGLRCTLRGGDDPEPAIHVPVVWLWDGDPVIRRYAACWTERTPEALAGIVNVVKTDPEDEVRSYATEILGGWPDHHGAVASALVCTLADERQSVLVRCGAAFALAYVEDHWRPAKGSREWDRQEDAAAYRRIEREGGPLLDAMLRDRAGDPELRAAAAGAAAELGRSVPVELVPIIRRYVEEPPRYARVPIRGQPGAGLRGLGACEGDRAASGEFLLNVLSEPDIDLESREAAIASLERLGEPYDRIMDALPAEEHKPDAVFVDWREAMCRIDAHRPGGLGKLVARLQLDGWRGAAAEALGEMGPAAAPAVPELADLVRRLPGEARCAEALGCIGVASPEVIEALRAVAADSTRWDAGSAVWALGELREPADEIAEALTAALDRAEKRELKAEVVWALHKVPGPGQAELDRLAVQGDDDTRDLVKRLRAGLPPALPRG